MQETTLKYGHTLTIFGACKISQQLSPDDLLKEENT